MSAPAKVQAMEALIDAHADRAASSRPSGLASARSPRRRPATSRPPIAYLAALLEAEISERAERRERRRLIDARFPLIKRLEDFRFAENPKVPQATIAALAQGSWIDDRESVILLGDSGTGKTMLAIALAVCACQQGRRVRFTTLAALANELQEAESRRELGRVVARYARTELVVLDELGYLALPDGAAELVFQVISERNERGVADRHDQPPVRRVDQGLPRRPPRQGRRRPHHPPSAHHRHRNESPGASATASTAQPRKEPPDPPTEEPRRRASRSARPTGSAPRDARRTTIRARSTTHNNRREVGPLQAAAPGPLQTAAPTGQPLAATPVSDNCESADVGTGRGRRVVA